MYLRIMHLRWVGSVVVCLFALALRPAAAAEHVDVVVGAQAPKLEKFAADELASQFQRLFGIEATVKNAVPADATHLVLIGSPASNPAVQRLAGGQWPAADKLSPQGIVIKSFQHQGKPTLVVGGGSPVATLWAVYELGYRHGVRYVLREDIFPDPKPIELDGLDVVMEPALKTRAWRTVNDFATGPESWAVADHRRLVGQLAKMKFNHLVLSVYPWQPFLDFEFRGVRKQTSVLWYGERLRMDGDVPGKNVFAGKTVFENADFAGKNGAEEMTAAGIQHLRGIIAAARELGMTVGLLYSPLEFPNEFAKVLPGAKPAHGLKELTIRPGAESLEGTLAELVKKNLRAYLETYPDLDAVYLTLPEFPDWTEPSVDRAWRNLQNRGGLEKLSLDELVQQARDRTLVASGERGERAVRGNIVALAFLNQVLADPALLRRKDGKNVALSIASVDPALAPVLDRVLPAGAGALQFVDYTSRRSAEHLEILATVPTNRVRARLILTLADDNIGVVSQSATRSIEKLVDQIRKQGWDGFSTRYWSLGELDPTVHYLSRAAYDASVTHRAAHDELFATITGHQAAADRMWLGMGRLEDATDLIDQNDLGFAFPVPGMLMRHYKPEPAPTWWAEASKHYEEAMNETYRTHDAAHRRSRRLLFHYAKRAEYNLQYIGCLQAMREAAIAEAKGDGEAAGEQLDKAIESLYNAIDTLSDVVEDPSDRGLIAVLVNFGYRPLLEKQAQLPENTGK